MKRYLRLALIAVVLGLGLLLASCASLNELIFPEQAALEKEREVRDVQRQEGRVEQPESVETLIDPAAKPELKGRRANLLVVGDVLMHIPLINGAEQADGSYDFAYSYRYVAEEIAAADYAAFNMEGTLAGEPYEGYPIFSAPDILAPTMKDLGFDLAFAANNHCMDRGVEGVIQTAKKLKAAGLDLVGTREKAEDTPYVLKEINGLKLGFINFTYETDRLDGMRSLNGIPIPPEGEPLIDSFSQQRYPEDYMGQDLKKIADRIAQLKKENPDFIIALMHWGDEYFTTSNDLQKEIAKHLATQGVDLIVGAGPHVAQEVVKIPRPDGGETLCYYSLGNFISNQQFDTADNGGYAEDGLIALIQFESNIKGEKKISKAGYMATYCFKIHPANDTTYATLMPLVKALENPSEYQLEGGEQLLQSSAQRIKEVMSQNSPDIQAYRSVQDFIGKQE